MEKLEHILLIDDDETNNFLNQRLLSRISPHARVKIMENGHQAINYLYNISQENYDRSNPDYFKPQLILVDLNMPVMDGFEFLDMFQKLSPAFRSTIVLAMLTTSAQPEEMRRASEHQIDLLIKPLTAEMISSLQKKYFAGGPEEKELPQKENKSKTASTKQDNS